MISFTGTINVLKQFLQFALYCTLLVYVVWGSRSSYCSKKLALFVDGWEGGTAVNLFCSKCFLVAITAGAASGGD
jgi:hypothetical protein